MDQINNGLDLEFQKAIESAVGPIPVPDAAGGVDAVPRNSVTRGGHTQLLDHGSVVETAAVVIGEFIFVEDAACLRPGSCNKGVFNSRGPEEG